MVGNKFGVVGLIVVGLSLKLTLKSGETAISKSEKTDTLSTGFHFWRKAPIVKSIHWADMR
jgi:hypothetical protein